MKRILLLLLLASRSHGELSATFHTTLGDVTATLQYSQAPQAVANFITLAQGTRGHLDPTTGAISHHLYYTGEKFFRVVNDTSFKIIQTGSGTGTNSGGPGYTFRDEFNPTLIHVPYVLSMANSGPNSNGSQIFLTGNTSIPSLNNVHTIFGLITDISSKATIDAILTAGNDAATITGVTISRTDPAAEAFDEFAQSLPTVTCPGGHLAVVPSVSNTYFFDTPLTTGDVFRAYRSTTLAANSWAAITNATRYVGLPATATPPTVVSTPIDSALESKAFYNLSVTRHTGSVAPDTLANRTITMPLSEGILTYAFDTTGVAGTTTYSPNSGSPTVGPFTTYSSFYQTDPNNLSVACYTQSLSPANLWLKIGCDTASPTLITCHHSTQYYNGTWLPFANGSLTITR